MAILFNEKRKNTIFPVTKRLNCFQIKRLRSKFYSILNLNLEYNAIGISEITTQTTLLVLEAFIERKTYTN